MKPIPVVRASTVLQPDRTRVLVRPKPHEILPKVKVATHTSVGALRP